MGELTADAVWDAIQSACDRGKFVPVIGFDMAASYVYADAQAESDDIFATTTRSMQTQELAHVAKRVSALVETLSAEERNSDAAGYAERLFADQHSIHSACEPGDRECDSSDKLFVLQKALLYLSAALTKQWAEAIAMEPRPLASTYAELPVPLKKASAYGFLRDAIDAALFLGQARGVDYGALRKQDINWIYIKLLRLAADVVLDEASLWADSAFLLRHRPLMSSLHSGGRDTGWVVSGSGTPRASDSDSPGVRLGHLVWLEHLLQFTLLSETRAFRTRHEIAFALSLGDPGVGIPRIPSDPFEVGLLYSEIDLADSSTLIHLIQHASRDDVGSPRPPGSFHRTLARIVRRNLDMLEERDPVEARKQIVISLGMDLSMERALEEQFDEYSVLVPVFAILRAGDSPRKKRGAPASEDEGGGEAPPRNSDWLLAHVRKADGVFTTAWQDVRVSPHNLGDSPGPLLIKLFGSPCHSLPEASTLGNPNLDTEIAPNPIHRLVLDEMELLNLLLRLTPEEGHLHGLVDRLERSQLFFFGESTLSWGDRVPYLMVDKIQGSKSPQGHRKKRGTDTSSVAMAKGNAFVSGVWNRLNVAQLREEEQLELIVSRIVSEVSTW